MALQKCHECGKDVSTTAKACPSCGASVKKPLLQKNIGCLCIVVSLIVILWMCYVPSFNSYKENAKNTPAVPVTAQPKLAPTPAQARDKAAFEIVSFRGEWQGGTLYIIGEIRNNGNIPGGPKVEVIARDSQGMLIGSDQFWPNSTNNILPGSSCGIKYPVTEDTRAKTLGIKVIGVSNW